MTKEWSLSEDKHTLRSPSGISLRVAGKIREILSFESLAVVLLDYGEMPSSAVGRNVYAYRDDGELLWQIAAIPEGDPNPYAEIRKKSETLATLHNWASFYRLVDVRTGEILSTKECR